MDYRSPFELRQQIFEESRATHPVSNSTKGAKRAKEPAQHPPAPATGASSGPFMPSTVLPDDPTALVREIPGAENLKALNAAFEHEAAVQKYMESENLSLEESAKYIMANGSTAQRMSFFAHLHDTLDSASSKVVSKVLAILLDSMWAQDPELQCRAPENLLNLLGLLNSSTAEELLGVIQTMLTVKTAAVRQEWGKLLLGLVSVLTTDQIERSLIPLTLSKSEHAQPQDQRELSCDVLGRICAFLPKQKVENLILQRAQALCQDTNVGVRHHMCQQLGAIARSLGIEAAKKNVAPDLFELLNDEERTVSRAAFSCLLDLVEFFGPEYRKEKLYPIIRSYVSNPPVEVTSLLVVEYGRFLDEIKGDIATQEDVVLFASFFQAACQRSDEEARRNCAFNFPAVTASLPRSIFASHLSPCLIKLAGDPEVAVRRSIAAGLHELVAILGDTTAATYLERPFLTLIRDKNYSVRSILEKNIAVLIDCFVSNLVADAREELFENVKDTIMDLAPGCSTNWRTMSFITQILDRYLTQFSNNTLEVFIPLLINYVRDGANVLKDECACLVVRIISQVPNDTLRVHIFSRLNNEFARHASCYQRQSYFRFVREICAIFSRRCIRERLFECCLELQRDSVTFVRLSLARTLPYLSKGLRSNTSGALEEEFNCMIQRLVIDEVTEIRLATRESKTLIEQIEEDRKAHPKKAEREETEERRKEKAEQTMLDLAKECDKAERRAKLRDLLKVDRERNLVDVATSVSRRSGNSNLWPTTPVAKQKTSRNSSGQSRISLPRITPAKTQVGVGVPRKRL